MGATDRWKIIKLIDKIYTIICLRFFQEPTRTQTSLNKKQVEEIE